MLRLRSLEFHLKATRATSRKVRLRSNYSSSRRRKTITRNSTRTLTSASTGSKSKSKEAEKAREAAEFYESAGSCSLAPGERARVRASVPLTFLPDTQRRHRPRVSGQWMLRARLQLAEDRVPNRLLVPTQSRI